MSLQEQIEEYFNQQQSIFDAFGYKENWTIFPMEDNTEYHWFITSNEKVVYSNKPFTIESVTAGTHIYSGVIYTYCHLTQWVFTNETHTMALVDIRSDRNILLMIFKNENECKDEEIIQTYKGCW